MGKASTFARWSGRTLVVATLVPLVGEAHAQQRSVSAEVLRESDIVVTGTKAGDFGVSPASRSSRCRRAFR